MNELRSRRDDSNCNSEFDPFTSVRSPKLARQLSPSWLPYATTSPAIHSPPPSADSHPSTGPARAVQIRPLSVTQARPPPSSQQPCPSATQSRPTTDYATPADVFVPIGAMLHYGDPEWYEKHVGPFRSAFRMDHKKQVGRLAPSSVRHLILHVARRTNGAERAWVGAGGAVAATRCWEGGGALRSQAPSQPFPPDRPALRRLHPARGHGHVMSRLPTNLVLDSHFAGRPATVAVRAQGPTGPDARGAPRPQGRARAARREARLGPATVGQQSRMRGWQRDSQRHVVSLL